MVMYAAFIAQFTFLLAGLLRNYATQGFVPPDERQ